MVVSKGVILLRGSSVPPRMRFRKAENYDAFMRLQSVSRFPCRPEEWRVRISGMLSSNGDAEGAAESLQHRSGDRPQKGWLRKQSTTRALGLNNKVVRLTGEQRNLSGDHEGELRTGGENASLTKRWFPHLNAFQITEETTVTSGAIVELLDPFLSEERKQRIETG